MHRIFVINPGSTSTKLALYEGENVIWNENILYSQDQLSQYPKVIDQKCMRLEDIEAVINDKELNLESLSAVVGRGGPFKPLESGTYRIDAGVLKDIQTGRVQAEHISNTGALLAHEIAQKVKLPAFFVDPVSVDEFEPIARLSGIPEIERFSLIHALNIKATALRAARDMECPLTEMNLIVAHLGGGISVCPIRKGRMIDVNNANEEGPFSPERSGTLPVSTLAKLCFSEQMDYQEMKHRLVGNGGLVAYLGTNDSIEVERRIGAGDEDARLVYEAMAYQIAKEIGAMATVLKGKVDGILMTGGLAKSNLLMDWIRDRIEFIAPVFLYPGENEMASLAMGALRVLRGEEKAKIY